MATAKETELKREVSSLKKKGIVPKLVSILVSGNKASKLFLSLKKEAAERVGARLEIKKFQTSESVIQLIKLIEKLNGEGSVHGVMVQLPLPEGFSERNKEKIINAISPEKDVDGMREESPFVAPVVKAVLSAIKEASFHLSLKEEEKVVVVGAKGFVGRKIFKALNEAGYDVKGIDFDIADLKKETLQADILVSVTGEEGLITGDMVKRGAAVIDVGAPKGDVVAKQIVKKASFISPVPGGIGPITVSYLLENLVEAARLAREEEIG